MGKAELKQIYPEFNKIQPVSPFCNSEDEPVYIEISDYETIKIMMDEISMEDKIDNICYILILLRKEKQANDFRKSLKNKSETRDNNRLEYSKFLKLQQSDNDIRITNIRFDVKKITGFSVQRNEYIYSKKTERFNIQDAEIIDAVLQILNSKYKYQMSLQEDFKDNIKQQKKINNETTLRKQSAKNLKKYLSINTNLGENKQYYVIGYLFQLAGLETNFSEKDFSAIMNNSKSIPYKSYADFITTNIRNKYFKKG